jgi:Xaa-Pro aminopeptidase
MSDCATEAERKRSAALEQGGPFVTNDPADVRWLLCGRGRPVSAGSSPYTVDVTEGAARVWYQDIERTRVESEERWEELGYEPAPYPWFEPPPALGLTRHLQGLRLELGPEEVERYRRGASDAADALVDVLGTIHPEQRELDVAGALAGRLHALGFTTPVVLVGGEERAPVHRHPLPTEALVGRFGLIAFTAERDGLHTSMTRIVSFGAPPPALERVVEAAAEVDAAVLAEARPGRTLGDLLAVVIRAYDALGLPDEWRRHHQGGLTGYKGREVFAVPGDETVLPSTCVVAFNPSVTGGGKSEDTVLVRNGGVEVLTRTPALPELANGRPAIVVA